MPTSRKRRTGKSKPRRANGNPARNRASTGGGPVRPLRDEDFALLLTSAALEANGDAQAALACYRRIKPFSGNAHEDMLRQLVELEGFLPPWVYARWVLEQALRYGGDDNESRVVEARVVSIEAAHVRGVDQFEPYGLPAELFLGLLQAGDWVFRQLFLFDLGGLSYFLANGASHELLARSGPIATWPHARMGAYRLVQESATRLTFDDLAAGEEITVLNLGTAGECELGDTVLGRIVDITDIADGPGAMFESRPLSVDEKTASEVAEDPDDWLRAVRAAHLDGRLPYQFSWRPEGQPLPTDIPELVWRSALTDDPEQLARRLRGGDRARLEDALIVVRAVLVAEPLLEPDARVAAPAYAGSAMLAPGVVIAMREELVLPQFASAWRELAGLLAGPAGSLASDLAARAAEFGREAS